MQIYMFVCNNDNFLIRIHNVIINYHIMGNTNAQAHAYFVFLFKYSTIHKCITVLTVKSTNVHSSYALIPIPSHPSLSDCTNCYLFDLHVINAESMFISVFEETSSRRAQSVRMYFDRLSTSWIHPIPRIFPG